MKRINRYIETRRKNILKTIDENKIIHICGEVGKTTLITALREGSRNTVYHDDIPFIYKDIINSCLIRTDYIIRESFDSTFKVVETMFVDLKISSGVDVKGCIRWLNHITKKMNVCLVIATDMTKAEFKKLCKGRIVKNFELVKLTPLINREAIPNEEDKTETEMLLNMINNIEAELMLLKSKLSGTKDI